MNIFKAFYGQPALAALFLILAFADTFINPVGKNGFDYLTEFGKFSVTAFYVFLFNTFGVVIYSVIKELKK